MQNMKCGVIITNGYMVLSSLRNLSDRLKEELERLGVRMDVITSMSNLAVIENATHSPKPEYDFAVFLDKDKYVAMELEASGLRLFNSASAIEKCDDKMLTCLSLMDKGIKMPKTVSGPLKYLDAPNDAFIDALEKELDYPMVFKPNYGSTGHGIELIADREQLLAKEDAYAFTPRLYQQFISSSFGFDYRIIVIGGKCVAYMKRESLNGDFRSNVGLGGEGKIVRLPSSYIEMAEKAAKELGLDYCGCDILQGENGEPILCEVNSNAFIKGIESVTGINVAKAYAEHICSTIYS